MPRQVMQTKVAALQAEVRELRRERAAILAALANRSLPAQFRITALALTYWVHEQSEAGGPVVLDAEEVARRAGTTPGTVRAQVRQLAAWGFVQTTDSPVCAATLDAD